MSLQKNVSLLSVIAEEFSIKRTDGRSVHSITPTSHHSSQNELGKLVRSALQQSTDGHNDGAIEDGLFPSQWVSNEDSEDGAQETSQVVRGHRNSLVARSSGLDRSVKTGSIGVNIGEIFREGGQVQ